MTYRDENEALRAQVAALMQEVSRLQQERDMLRARVSQLQKQLERHLSSPEPAPAQGEAARATIFCGACGAKNAASSLRCAKCGEQLRLEQAVSGGLECPCCKQPLSLVKIQQLEMQACGSCGGLWLEREQMESLRRLAKRGSLPSEVFDLGLIWNGEPPLAPRPMYLRCLRCHGVMDRKLHGESGVVVDRCREHGFWLDRGELEKILGWERQAPERPDAAPARVLPAAGMSLPELRSPSLLERLLAFFMG